MDKKIVVIVSKCVKDRIYGESLIDTYATLEEARRVGESKRADGMSVVVRPSFNEEDDNGRFFREWRSFNGEEFREVRFSY